MPQTILIADDFRDFVSLLEKTLKAEGFETITAYDGAETLEAARSRHPDLILLDIMMPNVSGTEVRNALGKDPSTRNIPIIFLTGLRAPHSTKKPLLDGVKVIGKSRNFDELLAAIWEALGKPAC